MRTLEIIILLINTPWLLWPLIGKTRPSWLHLLPVIATLVTVSHLASEGYRWQMIPAYTLTITVLILAALRLRQPPKRRHPLWGAVGLVVLGLAFALPILLPVPKLPPATGTYPVATTTMYLIDNGRSEIWSDTPGPRELVLQLWYPAAPEGDEETAVYLPELDQAGPVVAAQFNLPPFLLNHVNLAKLDIIQDAPVANNGPFPLAIFAHGLTGLRVQNTTMARELASHGYIVAALDHTYGNAITVFPDGRTILYDPCRIFSVLPDCATNYVDGMPLVAQWTADLNFLLDTMEMWQATPGNRFGAALDLERIGVFGHSTGGGTAVSFCQQDTRCDALVGLDAWVLPVPPERVEDGLRVPALFISTPGWLGDENRARGEAILAATQPDHLDLRLANTAHFDFTDIVLLTPLTPQLGISGSIDSTYSLGIQNEYLLAFFDRTLRQMPSPILDQPSPYPELTINGR